MNNGRLWFVSHYIVRHSTPYLGRRSTYSTEAECRCRNLRNLKSKLDLGVWASPSAIAIDMTGVNCHAHAQSRQGQRARDAALCPEHKWRAVAVLCRRTQLLGNCQHAELQGGSKE